MKTFLILSTVAGLTILGFGFPASFLFLPVNLTLVYRLFSEETRDR